MTIVDGGVEERGYRPFGYIRDGCSRYLFALDPPCCRRGTASGALTWRRLCKMAARSSEVMPGLLAPRCANGVDAEWEPLLPGRGSGVTRTHTNLRSHEKVRCISANLT